MSGEESDPEFHGPIAPDGRLSNRYFYGLLLLLGLVFLGIAMPVLLGPPPRGGEFARAIQNSKQVGYALFNFENDHGVYPNDETAEQLLKGDADLILSAAGGSNVYFSQLISAGYVDQEAVFYVDTGDTIHPDNDISSVEELLKSGEVGFEYFIWDVPEDGTEPPGVAPLVTAYLERGDTIVKDFKGNRSRRLLILGRDYAVRDFKANRKGVVETWRGVEYFDWSQDHWGGYKPRIVWPE